MFEMTIMNQNEYLKKNDKRAERRKSNYSKAIRKRNICLNIYGHDWYHRSLNEYSKNKIHCSCGMCRFRSVYDPNNMPFADKKTLEDIKEQLKNIA